MKYKKYSPEGFENIRVLSMNYAISLLILGLVGSLIQGFGRQYYLLLMSFLVSMYLMIPGITMFTRPWISQAWLNALSFLLIPNNPWEELPGEIKALVFISSSISLLAGILVLALSVLTI